MDRAEELHAREAEVWRETKEDLESAIDVILSDLILSYPGYIQRTLEEEKPPKYVDFLAMLLHRPNTSQELLVQVCHLILSCTLSLLMDCECRHATLSWCLILSKVCNQVVI